MRSLAHGRLNEEFERNRRPDGRPRELRADWPSRGARDEKAEPAPGSRRPQCQLADSVELPSRAVHGELGSQN
eukprot:4319648-Pyramimonas_sp.AAC.1